MNSNKLVINPDKTHLMVMGTKRMAAKRREVSIQAGTFMISPTETETILGGKLHQSMQWNQHIRDGESSLLRQLTTRINGLKKISVNATFHTRLMVANGVVMSKMAYLITLWGRSTTVPSEISSSPATDSCQDSLWLLQLWLVNKEVTGQSRLAVSQTADPIPHHPTST